MLTLLLAIVVFISVTDSCSPAAPTTGNYYISKLELLSTDTYPDSVLLTIRRVSYDLIQCKLMNVTDGSLSDVVICEDYDTFTRSFASPDIDPKSTTVSCADNCDGATATCIITRDHINYTINNIPYTASSSRCTTSSPDLYNADLSISFTLSNLSTTYISFALNMVGVRFDDSTTPAGYEIITVDRAGDGWEFVKPLEFDVTTAPEIYSDVNVIRYGLPCCVCYDTALNTYMIEPDSSGSYDEIFTMNELTWGGNVDSVKQRVYGLGKFNPDTITVYDLLTGDNNTFGLQPSSTISDASSMGRGESGFMTIVRFAVSLLLFSLF